MMWTLRVTAAVSTAGFTNEYFVVDCSMSIAAPYTSEEASL
jgi:hypothetical protein